MITIELLSKEHFNPGSLDHYQRKQDVKRVYRRYNGRYILEDCVYTIEWDIEKRRAVAKVISTDDHITYLAIKGDEVAGFIGLKKDLIGSYMILDTLQVSASCRREGIGRTLLDLGRKEAGKVGAEALYISACSAEETIAFYKAMGAEVTESPIQEMVEAEPYDLQMICKIH